MEPNIHINWQEKSYLIEILHDTLNEPNLSQTAKAVIMGMLQKLNALDA